MGKEFQRVFRLGSGRFWHGKVRPEMTGWIDVCLLLDAPETELFHDSAKIRAGRAGGFFVKRYNLPGWFTQLRRLFKISRAAAVRKGAERLAALGILTPRVMASVTGWRFLRRREYLITELMAEDETLLHQLAGKTPAEAMWRILMEQFLPMMVKLCSRVTM